MYGFEAANLQARDAEPVCIPYKLQIQASALPAHGQFLAQASSFYSRPRTAGVPRPPSLSLSSTFPLIAHGSLHPPAARRSVRLLRRVCPCVLSSHPHPPWSPVAATNADVSSYPYSHLITHTDQLCYHESELRRELECSIHTTLGYGMTPHTTQRRHVLHHD